MWQGAGSRPMSSPGVHLLHVREPAARGIAGRHARASDERGGASVVGREFEACGVTGRPSASYLYSCNTRHRRHARASDERAGASVVAREFEACGLASPGVHLLHIRHPATRDTAEAREASDERAGTSGGGRGFEACGVTGRSSAACSHPCHTRHRRHARRQMIEPVPVGQGAGSRPVASPGDHLLHVRPPATRGIAGTRGVR